VFLKIIACEIVLREVCHAVARSPNLVDVEFLIKLPLALTVPTDAVLDSGLRKTVFVDRGNGFFIAEGSPWVDRNSLCLKRCQPG
jgi:hypothetical protein